MELPGVFLSLFALLIVLAQHPAGRNGEPCQPCDHQTLAQAPTVQTPVLLLQSFDGTVGNGQRSFGVDQFIHNIRHIHVDFPFKIRFPAGSASADTKYQADAYLRSDGSL